MIILPHASEKGTYVITIAFTDSQGQSVTPKSATWSLTYSNKAIINNRLNVPISPLEATVSVVLAGNDLALPSSDMRRFFHLHYVYDSTEGNDMEMNAEATFDIEDLMLPT